MRCNAPGKTCNSNSDCCGGLPCGYPYTGPQGPAEDDIDSEILLTSALSMPINSNSASQQSTSNPVNKACLNSAMITEAL